MPLFLRKEIADETQLAIWKIEESADWFRSQLKLDSRENALIDSIRHPQRKIHWLSSRVLIRILLNNPDDLIHLESDERGKPLIHNFPVKISISHSAEFSALLMSKNFDVGVDIEKIDAKIEKIQYKFMSDGELKNLSATNRLKHLYIYWCAKEAMYKLHGKKQLDFRKHLSVAPFQFANRGIIHGEICKDDFRQALKITFENSGDFMLAYTIHA